MWRPEHTPGPLIVWGKGIGSNMWYVDGPDGKRVALVDRETDARLFAAAPDLLLACEAALPLLMEASELVPDGALFDNGIAIKLLEAAIAKARGEANDG